MYMAAVQYTTQPPPTPPQLITYMATKVLRKRPNSGKCEMYGSVYGAAGVRTHAEYNTRTTNSHSICNRTEFDRGKNSKDSPSHFLQQCLHR